MGLISSFLSIRDFLERGGAVLLVLLLIIFVMWTLVLSRWLYLQREYQGDIAPLYAHWNQWFGDGSAHAVALKAQFLSAAEYRLNAGIALIRTLASLCPLMGLLGTVVGMILVFHMMGAAGAGSPRVVAAGVSTAMVTTMAGMVGALSGIFPAAMLARRARSYMDRFRAGDGTVRSTAAAYDTYRRIRRSRLVIAPVGAFLVTASLAFGMEQMIRIGETVMTDEVTAFSVDFVRVERSQAIRAREPKPDRPETAQPAPDLEMVPEAPGSSTSGIAISIPRPSARVDMSAFRPQASAGFSQISDGEYLPIVKVAPVYPRRAAALRLEGYVIVEFVVTTSGSVRDVTVVESSSEIFEQPAITAAQRFRYRPRVIDGEPVAVAGVQNRITFVLDQ